MARRDSFIPVQIQCLIDDESSIRNKIFRRDSSLSNKSGSYSSVERRLSLKNFFSKADGNDAASTPNFQDENHLKLFKSKEFQAYLKERNILATAGLQVIFQQFLQDRNYEEHTNERVGVAAYRRKSSGDSLLSVAGGYTTSSLKRRGTTASDNSLDDSIWSIDDSCRRDYMGVIRGDTESIFRQPQEVEIEQQQQLDDEADEESMLKSFFKRSSNAMSASIDASYRNRRDSIFSAFSGRDHASSMPSDTQKPLGHGKRWEVSCQVQQRVRADDDSSVRLEDLLKNLGDDDDNTLVEDDKSNNGEVEVFFLSRRRSISFDVPPRRSSLISSEDLLKNGDDDDDKSNNGEVEVFFLSRRRSISFDLPPRRSSLISRASETSSQLQKCLNEINGDNIRSSIHTNASGDGDSLGKTSFASDQALLWKSNNFRDTYDALPHLPKFVELQHDPQSKSCSKDCGDLHEDFSSNRVSLLVEWGEAQYDSEDDSV